MKKLLFFAPALLSAQSIKNFTVGQLSCGILRRGAETVQVYCYGADKKTVMHNAISTVLHDSTLPKVGILQTYSYGEDGFAIYFNLVNGVLYYEVAFSSNTSELAFVGYLTSIYGATGDGCNLPVDRPRFWWTSNGTSQTNVCVSIWALSNWSACCLSTGVSEFLFQKLNGPK